jgi:RNA polymerase sigma-70 factor (ECF subfamily)
MDDNDWLAEQFEEYRSHLRTVAFRMLGSLSDADDAVQESWLRLSHRGAAGVDNLGGWLTTVVARVSLDMLRSRRSRREDPVSDRRVDADRDPAARHDAGIDPEHEAVLAASVGPALLVVLETLAPAERLAFVLHDMFAVPFDEIATIVGRSSDATRQLASRARRRVQGADAVPGGDRARQRKVVDAFLAASRSGDFDALLAVLDPDVVRRADAEAIPAGAPRVVRGSLKVARQAVAYSRLGRFAQPVVVNGTVGLVAALGDRRFVVLAFTILQDRITGIDVIADPERLGELDVSVLSV